VSVPFTSTDRETAVSVSHTPKGYHTATPYLVIKGAGAAIDFYKKVFGATEVMRMPGPGGMVMHAEIKIGDSMIMLADEFPDMGHRGPLSIGGSPVGICLYFPDVDARFAAALKNGATEKRPVQNQFYGDRSGTIVDPFGHIWTISTHVEDVAPDEMNRRFEAEMKKMPG
jgi:PhnB protein